MIEILLAGVVLYLLVRYGIFAHILDTIDLSENLTKAVQWAKTVRGVPAAAGAVAFSLIAFVCAGLAVRYDLLPTYRFILPVGERVLEVNSEYLAYFTVFLTLLPTLIEIASAGLIKQQITAMQYAAYFFIAFDLFTDYFEARLLVIEWEQMGLFNPLGPFASTAKVILEMGWTFLASFGFEFLAVLCFITALLLAANSRAPARG